MLLSRQALDQARRLEPDLSGVKFLTMTIQYTNRQWGEVEQTMDRGAGLKLSSNFDLMYGWVGFLIRVGRIHESLPLLERMRYLNPYSSGTAEASAYTFSIVGQMGKALAEAERAFELDGFKSKTVGNGLMVALSSNDRRVLLKWLARAKQYIPESRELLTAMSETLDDREAALDWLHKAYERNADHDFLFPIWAAWHGDNGLALDAMERWSIPYMYWGVELAAVRTDPRFKDLVRQEGLEDYFREYGWNDFCRPLGPEDFECE